MAVVASHEVVFVPDVLKSTSPLTSDSTLEKYEDADQMEEVIGNRVEVTFVPMRNTFFLTLAMNRAVALGVRHLVTGICQEDNANYPDCTESFRVRFEDMANQSLGLLDPAATIDQRFQVHAPLMFLSKAKSVRLATKLAGCYPALAYTHTSYDGRYPPDDKNHANLLRAKGFQEANLPDPLVTRAFEDGLMSLPETANYDQYSLTGKLPSFF